MTDLRGCSATSNAAYGVHAYYNTYVNASSCTYSGNEDAWSASFAVIE